MFKNALPVHPLEFDRSKIKEMSEDDIVFLRTEFETKVPRFCWTANYMYFTGEKKVNWVQGAACHAGLPRINKDAFSRPFATENGSIRKHGKENLEVIKPFLHWFLYISPYGEFILNRDDFDYCQLVGFIVNPSIPQPVFMNLCILSRHFYEGSLEVFKLFNKLTLKKGFDPTIVYSTLFNTYTIFNNGLQVANQKYRGCSGHRVAEAYSPPVLLNIFNGVYGHKQLLHMGKHSYITGTKNLFTGNCDYVTLTDWATSDEDAAKSFRLALSDFRNANGKTEAYRPPNPFKRAHIYDERPALGPEEFTNREAVDFVIPWLDAHIRKELQQNAK